MTHTPIQPEQETAYDVDFLPASYHDETVHRKLQSWRMAAIAILACLISLAALHQSRSRKELEGKLAWIVPHRVEAEAINTEYIQLQADLARMEARANLVTYLRHPWPCSQILAAVLRPLPDEIMLRELRIAPEVDGTQPIRRLAAGAAADAKAVDQFKRLDPALQDLQNLHEELDARLVVVELVGVADDAAALHSYLGHLMQHPLIAKSELKSIERSRLDAGSSEFRARCVLIANFGQPSCPLVEPAAKAAGDAEADQADLPSRASAQLAATSR